MVTVWLNLVVLYIERHAFVKGYEPSMEECLGVAIAQYVGWDSRIFRIFYEALEQANFHKEAAEIDARYITKGGDTYEVTDQSVAEGDPATVRNGER